MPAKKYVGKTNRGGWTEGSMDSTIATVKVNHMGLKKAAKQFKVP